MYNLYTLCLCLGGSLFLPYLLWRCWRGTFYHRDIRERFGGTYNAAVQQALQGCVWFHAASVGEIQNLHPVITAVHQRFPSWPILVSTFTPTGKSLAARVVTEATQVRLLPVDLPWIVQRLVRRLHPRALIVQETELWPHLFRTVVRSGAPVILVNGRLSPRATRRYRWIRPLMRRVLSQATLLLVQSQENARRFQSLGAPLQRLQVTGHSNIDRALHIAARPAQKVPLAAFLTGRQVLIAGSTHEGEERLILHVVRRLQEHGIEVQLLLAPRHLERTNIVVRQVQEAQYRAVRRSQCELLAPEVCQHAVIVLDTLGELAALYRLCTVAFVGGSLVPIGGHNILEPAMYAKPVLFGPYMQHFPDLAALLCEAGGALQVRNAEALFLHLKRLLTTPGECEAMGQRALQALQANQGALERTTTAVMAVLQTTA